MYKCGICDESFSLPKELTHHRIEIHATKRRFVQRARKRKMKRFQCFLCRMYFDFAKELSLHMRLHQRKHKCQICKMELTHKELNEHLCGDEKNIRCEYCGKKFPSTLKVLSHIEKSHQKFNKFHKCDKCRRFFSMISLKNYHMKTHEHDPPAQFVCKICSKAFACKETLKIHSRIHNNMMCK